MPTPEFVVGRQAEVALFDDLLAGRTPYRLLEIYGPGGIGKTVVGSKLLGHAQACGIPMARVDGIQPRPDARPHPGPVHGRADCKPSRRKAGRWVS